MKIQHNLNANFTQRQMSLTNTKMKKSLEKLSSGYRINRASDNAGSLVISEKMRTNIKGLEQVEINVQDGLSLIDIADAAMSEIHSILGRVSDLSMQSANAVLDDDDRKIIQSEVEDLLETMDSITKGTNFNGLKVLKGGEAERGAVLPPWASRTGVGLSTHILLQIGIESDSQLVIELPDLDMDNLGLTGASALTQGDAVRLLDATKEATNVVSRERARMGAYQNRLEGSFKNYIAILRENTQAAESRLRDTDMATEMVGFSKDNIIMKASEAMLAQTNLFPQSVMQLLA